MIVKKLAVPLINEKILQQAVHVYIATSSVSEAGFDFIRSRIPAKTKMDIVTSLQELSSPAVLKRILINYQGRISLNIYTRNVLHANMFVFELPYRKYVAFVGSGALTMDGLKDHEELFWKISDPKEVESLLSWYTSYFQFSVPLNEELVREYEYLYPRMKRREITTRTEREDLINLTASSFRWESIRFKNQYFAKEDYMTFSNEVAPFENAQIRLSRMSVQQKLQAFADQLVKDDATVRLGNISIESIEIADHVDRQINSLGVTFSAGSPKEMEHRPIDARISLLKFSIGLVLPAASGTYDGSRAALYDNLSKDESKAAIHSSMMSMLSDFELEVAGVSRPVTSFNKPDVLMEFLNEDKAQNFPVVIRKVFSPGDPLITGEKIIQTASDVIQRLLKIMQTIGGGG